MICQNCNKEIAEESVSCPVCGAQVNRKAQQGEDQYEKAVQECTIDKTLREKLYKEYNLK